MIISRIIGGLGNQMFQYAAGFRLSKKVQTELKIDTSAFATYQLHGLSIGNFCISATIASKADTSPFTGQSSNQILEKLRRMVQAPTRRIPGFIHEPKFTFNPEILELTGGSIYLDGYWQSEKYFADVADDIRKEFIVANVPDEINRAMLAHIQATESVCLHIRRGDYIKNQQTNSVHGTIPLTYYHKALEYLRTKRNKLTLFIFSDDIEWVRQNFKTDFPMIFVDHNNPEKNYEDIRLMSTCKNHIIANSTFSWWGAWLSGYAQQIAIAPKRWFRTKDIDSQDIIPSRWLKL